MAHLFVSYRESHFWENDFDRIFLFQGLPAHADGDAVRPAVRWSGEYSIEEHGLSVETKAAALEVFKAFKK